MSNDLFQSPDYYQLDDLFSEEHLMVREATREWVKRAVSPIIEDCAQRAEFPKELIKGLAEVGHLARTFQLNMEVPVSTRSPMDL